MEFHVCLGVEKSPSVRVYYRGLNNYEYHFEVQYNTIIQGIYNNNIVNYFGPYSPPRGLRVSVTLWYQAKSLPNGRTMRPLLWRPEEAYTQHSSDTHTSKHSHMGVSINRGAHCTPQYTTKVPIVDSPKKDCLCIHWVNPPPNNGYYKELF